MLLLHLQIFSKETLSRRLEYMNKCNEYETLFATGSDKGNGNGNNNNNYNVINIIKKR